MEKAMKRAMRPTLVSVKEEKIGFITRGVLLGKKAYGTGGSLSEALGAMFRNYKLTIEQNDRQLHMDRLKKAAEKRKLMGHAGKRGHGGKKA